MNTEPIRVLQVIGIVAGGGVESVVMNYYKHIDRSKVQFDFVVHDDNIVDITDIVESMGGKVYKVPSYSKNIFGFMQGVYHIVKAHKYNIVHCHMTTLGVFSLGPAWLAGAKVRILHGHNTTVKSETKRNIMKMFLRPLSVFVANRYFACSRAAAHWLYGSDKDSRIINNAIDVECFQYKEEMRQALRNELGLVDKFIIGHIGRFVYQKNHEFLIRLFHHVAQELPDAHLVLVGDGPLRESILNQLKLLGLLERVTYLGLRDDVYNLYSLFDVFYFPSWYEGLGVVAIESQAAKLPILMSNFVPDEAIIDSSLAKKIGITDEDIDIWINETKRIYSNINHPCNGVNPRIGINNCINTEGYNIQLEAKRLEELYCEYSKI